MKTRRGISISKPYISKTERDAVVAVLRSGHLVEGTIVEDLERRVTQHVDSNCAIAVNSGTAALYAALYALGVGKGDEVITTPFTFIATANAILMVGATPVFVDIQPNTFTVDPKEIEKRITNRTKAIIAVDLYGQPADYKEIISLAKKRDIFVIDDAAQSIGATYEEKKIGSIADITCFSFYATKNVMCGEGGMITTNNAEVADRIRRFKNHGQRVGIRYDYTGFGFNYRMTDIAAAIVREQLKTIDMITKKRNAIAHQYDAALSKKKGIIVPYRAAGRTHVFHQYTIRITEEFHLSRDEVKKRLMKKDIQTEIYYPFSLEKYSHLVSNGKTGLRCKEAAIAAQQVLSLPVYPRLQSQQIRYIIGCILSL